MRNTATTVRWQDGKFSVGGQKDFVKGKALGLSKGPLLNGVKDMGKMELDDARAVVVNGAEAEDLHMGPDDQEIVISSSECETSSGVDGPSGSEAEEDEDEEGGRGRQVAILEDKDHDMADESAEEAAEPSFGDLIHTQAPQLVEVEAAFAEEDAPNTKEALTLSKPQPLAVPDSMSLGAVISQALRTNDTTLLESCLHTRDLSIIRLTIERLDSKLATTLLSKLAERLHRRPGRAGSLMVWVQWTLVSHGGYLVSQPNTMKQLGSLNKVISERVNALQPLLALKGKLDMLAAQSQLRRSMQSAAAAAAAREEDDEEGVAYIEGQEEDDSSDEAGQTSTAHNPLASTHQHTRTNPTTLANSPSSSSDSDSDMPTTTANGTTYPLSDAESSTSSLIDDEASETDASSEEEEEEEGEGINDEEVDHDSDDDDEEPEPGIGAGNEDSEDAAQMPPRKRHAGMRRSTGLVGRRR